MKAMTREDPRWGEFCDLLAGPEGCDFHRDETGEVIWMCEGDGIDRPIARKILKKYFKDYDVEETLKYFADHGGYCDCEILFNVARR